MMYTLNDYQAAAVREVLKQLTVTRNTFHRYGSRSQEVPR